MYLVDTSVWIDYIKGKDAEHVYFLDELLANPVAVGISPLIYMEILQGAKTAAMFERFKRYFCGQTFFKFNDELESYGAAAGIYFKCRKAGITLRSSVDCLIAQCALENELVLLHHDRDYQQLGRVFSELKQKCFL